MYVSVLNYNKVF